MGGERPAGERAPHPAGAVLPETTGRGWKSPRFHDIIMETAGVS
jgi:hypothetical protein